MASAHGRFQRKRGLVYVKKAKPVLREFAECSNAHQEKEDRWQMGVDHVGMTCHHNMHIYKHMGLPPMFPTNVCIRL